MPYIPTVPIPYPDEFIYSWINRIIKANALSTQVFTNAYLHNTTMNTYDCKNYTYLLFDNMFNKPNVIESYLSLSTFEFEALFMTIGQQNKYINNVFRKKSRINTPANSIVSTLKLCPECRKKDIDKLGEPYFHKSHQLSVIKVCPVHNCALLQYNGSKLKANAYDLDEYKQLDITDADIEAASMCNLLLNSHISGNIKDIKRIIYNRLNELNYSVSDGYTTFIEDISKTPYIKLISYDIARFLKSKLISASYISANEIIPLLLFLFPDELEFIRKFSSEPILSNYTCNNCNKEYVSTKELQKTGWGCPYCEPDDEITLARIINTTDKNYSLKGKLLSFGSSVNITHHTCGQVLKIKPRSFLFEGTRCKCEHQISFSQAKKNIEKEANFTLINYINTATPITVYSNSCGHTFDCIYSKFITSAKCRICNPKVYTDDSFQERVYKLVGDEYTVVGDYEGQHKKVLIRHNKCNAEHLYKPSNFFDGQRCPECSSLIHKKEFEALLYKYSSGRYTVISYGANLCQIIDNKSNTIISISPQKAIQEMTRITPSDMLPIDNWERIDINKYPISSWDIGYNTLLEYIKETGTTIIPKRDKYHDYPLGAWCQTQRDDYKNGKLKETRISRLNDIGFIWNIFEYEWNRKLEMLVRYAKTNNCDVNISRRTVIDGEKIGVWLFIQRNCYKEGILTVERKKKLEDIGIIL